MKKHILLFFAFAASVVWAQQLPSQGVVRLNSGKYTLSFLASRAWALGGFAFDDRQLFIKEGATADFTVMPAAAKAELVRVSLTVDGKSPETVGSAPISGKRLVLERVFRQAGLLVTCTTVLEASGATFAMKYKIEGGARPSSVYAFTFPWSTQFREGVTEDGGKLIFGDTGSWLVNRDVKYLALHRGDVDLGVVAAPETPIPTMARRHAVWDHKAYHKYFVTLRLPTWQEGFESPEYRMRVRVFEAAASNWQAVAHAVGAGMTVVAAPSKGSAPVPVPAAPSGGKRLNTVKIVPPGPVSGRMDWKNPRRGIEALEPDFVLPPFEAVECGTRGVKVWNREYRFGGNGLLGDVRVAGRPILAQPMRLEMVINGRPVVFRTGGAKLVSRHKGRAVYETTLTCDEATVLVKATVEYDGMVRMDLKLTPCRELSLDHFSYGFQMANTRAKYMHFIGNPSVSGLSIMVPSESFTFAIPQKPGEFFAEPFKTLVWLGDEDEGFLWFSGSERNFMPAEAAERPKALRAMRENGTSKLEGMTTFIVTPVAKSVRTSQPLEYTFGFFATPVRPMPKGWRNWFFTTRRGMYGSEASHGHVGNMPMIWPDEVRSTAGPLFSAEGEAKMKRFTEELHRAGRNALGYMDPIRVHMGYLRYLGVKPAGAQLNDLYLAPDPKEDAFLYRVPVVSENFVEWRTLPQVIYAYGAAKGGREVRVSSASSWADFFCYLCECYAKLGYDGMGDIDNCFPIRDMNEAHGRGYVGLDGKRHYEWDWFERRDLMKRMAAVFLKERGRPGILVAHSSATWSIPFISFCDANMTYEHSNSGYFASDKFMSRYNPESAVLRSKVQSGDPDFLRHAFPPSRWRAELTGRQFGLPCVVMSNLTKSPQIPKETAKALGPARALTANIAAHDAIMWPIWCDTSPLVAWQKIRERFGIEADEVEFLPYWSQRLVGSNAPFSISIYRRPGRALVAVCNLTASAATGDVDFSGLGLPNAIDAESGRPATGKALSLKSYDYAIFELSK